MSLCAAEIPGLGFLGYRWSVLVPARIEGQLTEAVLRKRFQEVEAHGDEVVAWGSYENCTDSVAPLVRDALTAESPAALARVWRLSLALYQEYRFLAALPVAPAEALAKVLGEELQAAAPRLTAETDARLLRFAAGRSDAWPAIPTLQLPASRLARLLEAERYFEHARHHVSDWYYDALASAFARIAEPWALGEVLRTLEPGSALLSALHAVCLDHPEVIADYAFYPPFHAEGAFALLQLQQHVQVGHTNQLDLDRKDEWQQVQRLGHELLVLSDQATDHSSLIALGIREESHAIGRRHYGVAPIDRRNAQYDGTALWAAAVAEGARGERYVEALEAHLQERTRHSDAAIVFALRLLRPLRDSGQAAVATRLATAIAGAYAAGLSLDAGTLAIPTVLCAYGELLADLRDALGADGEAWQTFLRPFAPATYLERARDDRSETVSSERINPSFDIPRIVRAHAETLVAMASAGDAFEEPLRAALELYDADRKAALNVGAFSWVGLARITSVAGRPIGEALFVGVGRLLARVAGSPPWLADFLEHASEPHILAAVAAGLGAGHPLAETIRPQLRRQLNALLADEHGVALGHALELAHLLQQAGMPRDSERLVRRAMEILETYRPGGHHGYSDLTRALLAGALAQQDLWPEILAFEADHNAIVLSPHARFVENMRALALMESGKLGQAEEVLQRVLRVDPSNGAALVGMTNLHLRAGDWTKAIAAAAEAKPLLSGDHLDDVLVSEAFAREQLGDEYSAAGLLGALSGRGTARADAMAMRERLAHGDRDAAPATPLALSAAAEDEAAPLATTDAGVLPTLRALPPKPEDAFDVAIITALEDEYLAMRKQLTGAQDVPPDAGQYQNLYGWVTGTIARENGPGVYRVVVAWAGCSGNPQSLITTMRTIDQWRPRYVLFCGIAGGLPKDGLRQGDIVLSQSIWYYEYAKVEKGKVLPRHRDSFRVDRGLLTSARIFKMGNSDWKLCGETPPRPNHDPNVVAGMIGSGEKVIDDRDAEYAKAILQERPELQAIEMEAVGACSAVEHANAEGKLVGFLMVRGISDMPGLGSEASDSGTMERDNWKPYVCALAAKFIASWIAIAWPEVPRAKS